MPHFYHTLWGYRLEYPEGWVHKTIGDTEGFAAVPEALGAGFAGENSGQLLIRAEGNWLREEVGPVWTRHIGLLASMIGARQVGSSPWRMGGAVGLEAEIVMPKKEDKRLWTGILAWETVLLKLMVMHNLEERYLFEPAATRVISSLQFGQAAGGLPETQEGIPLPPGYIPIEADLVVEDIHDPQNWRAFHGDSPVDGLQAFYLREAPLRGWKIAEFLPFSSSSDLGFARLAMERAGQQVTLGIMPYHEEGKLEPFPARIVIRSGLA
jgi:hypothetical protein